MSRSGKILSGVLAPHPPHLVYASNPPQNEPRSEGGWEVLRWGYESMREAWTKFEPAIKPDVFVIHSPHWQTVVGHHVLEVPQFKDLSVDPIFPHLFRFNYDVKVDTDLARQVVEQGRTQGLTMKAMRNPDFRIDYGAIVSYFLSCPEMDVPLVVISSNNSPYYFSNEVGQKEMERLGVATRDAIVKSGKQAILLASNSLSHRHFTVEPEIPEDMSKEHIYHHGQYLWDIEMLKLMKEGRARQLVDSLPEFMDMAMAEVKAGALTWMLSALGFPEYPAKVHAYGSVIGTGNAVVEWRHSWPQAVLAAVQS